ncbi:MAG: ribonucleoside-triphosphate reductase, partial [Parcubacteria group bacterium]|nr:ribonucleoside-triphosphate reductase [Parcubacteria group bacterium]
MAIRSYSADRKKVAAKTARQRKSPPEHIQLFVPTQIRKRNGTVVDFDKTRISIVVQKALNATKEEHKENIPQEIAEAVVRDLGMSLEKDKRYIPAVEEVQDLVERELVLHKLPKTAKAYILYREEHSKLRERGELKGGVPEHVKKLVTESKQYFRNQLAEYVYYSTYSKWIPEEGRREAWKETVRRYVDFMKEKLGDKLSEKEYAEIQEYIISMKSLGSMRLLWSAGTAVRKTNVCAYNCSFIAPTQWRDFAEIAYISMCGTGVGFSVEHQNVEKLPMIERQTGEKPLAFVIPDSKEGWADAITFGLTTWSSGRDVEFDYGQIRPAGARLKTMGGRASGPASLKALLDLARQKMLARQGRRLSTLDVHDIICKIGEIVVAGGVRRSALISLSDLDDVEMREAKNGQFYLANAQRSMANNSAVYNEQPTIREFLDEWANLVKSGSGERGIFNRGSLKKQLPARRWKVFAKDFWTSGTNP